MKKSDLQKVSTLHMRTLPTTIARIGNPTLSDLYRTLLEDICLVAVAQSAIIGVITATQDLRKTQHHIQKLFIRPMTLWSIVAAVLQRNVTIMELFDRINLEHELRRQFPVPYATILTFFVDRAHQRQGIGTQLLKTLQRQLPPNTTLYVDTKVSNTRAQLWYRTHGFRTLKTIGNSVIFCQISGVSLSNRGERKRL